MNVQGRSTEVKESPIYKQRRIHTMQLPSGIWRVAVANVGKHKMTSGDSLTEVVMRIPGEHRTEAEAIQAAKEYIDRQEANAQEVPDA